MGSLSRRDTFRLLLGAPFASLLACDDPPAPIQGELRGPDIERGHRLREPLELRHGEVQRTHVLIVGGGVAGLSAAWRLARRGVDDFLVVELEDAVGGTSRSEQSETSAFPWGAHYLPVPPTSNEALTTLLEEMRVLENGEPAEHVLVREPDERVFYEGYWYPGLYPYAGASQRDLQQLERFDAEMRGLANSFSVPVGTRAPSALELDAIDARTWMRQRGYDSERLLWLCDYATRDDYGLKLEHTSAWAHVFYWASRLDVHGESAPLLAWPEGNGALVNHMRSVASDRVRVGSMALRVEEHRDGVRTYLDNGTIVESSHVVLAVPRFIAARVAPTLDLGLEGFDYGAWMVANLHLRGRPWGRGSEPAWDNVLYDSPALGYVSATHQRGRDFGPTVWTYYLPLLEDDPRESRRALIEADHDTLGALVMQDLQRAHPNLRQQLERLDVWRWGHAMTRPRVGFLLGGRRSQLAEARGRIHLAHTDLSGMALFEEAFFHGVRAADEVV